MLRERQLQFSWWLASFLSFRALQISEPNKEMALWSEIGVHFVAKITLAERDCPGDKLVLPGVLSAR